jgi:hypothetical protein
MSGPGAGGGETIARLVEKLIERNEFVVDEAGNVFRHDGRSWEACSDAYLNKLALDVEGYERSTIDRRCEIIDMLKACRMMRGLRGERLAGNRLAGPRPRPPIIKSTPWLALPQGPRPSSIPLENQPSERRSPHSRITKAGNEPA